MMCLEMSIGQLSTMKEGTNRKQTSMYFHNYVRLFEYYTEIRWATS